MADLSDYNRFTSDTEVTKYMLFRPHQSLDESAASIEKLQQRYAAGNCFRWGTALKETNQLIGMIDLLRFDESTHSCSFAYMLSRDHWNLGYGTEALRAVLDFGFSQLGLERIEADHMAENAASGAVMAKAGMRYIGTTPKAYEKDGRQYDAVHYAITRDQWLRK